MKKSDHAPETAIEPLFYRAFPRIFGRAESKRATRSLVNAVFAHAGLGQIGEIERIDAEHTALGGAVDCKMPRMDVRIVAHDRLVDLESQCYPEDVDNRSLLYGAQLLTESTLASASYKELPQAVVVTLLDTKPLFPDSPDYVHVSRMVWDAAGDVTDGTDRLVFVLVELEKVRRRYNRLDSEVLADELLSWAYLLTIGYERTEEVAMIAEKIPSVEDFAELYGLAVDDPKVKRAYEDAVSAEREYKSRQDYLARIEREAAEEARARGEAEGYSRGEAEGYSRGEAEGFTRGEASGYKRGEEAGVEKSLVNSIINLMQNLHLDAQQAMDALQVPTDKRSRYLELIQG